MTNLLLLALLAAAPVAPETKPDDDKVLEGHSYHGEAFDQGPRQAAYLMPGMGNVTFPVTTKNGDAQKFVNQGAAQLHGFWYFEAERSFRQAAALDPDCAMAYWGMAMANVNNAGRAEKFLKEAVKRRDKASKREQLWIDAFTAFHKEKIDPKKDKEKDKLRRQALIKALENIIHEHPDDVEAKAQLVLTLYLSRGPIPISSREAVDALIVQVLEANPMHPVHHYRIHLWDDDGKATQALKSAALNGQSTPGIAHQWHMPGHTFSKLQRYGDAAWQQEAASRVDHAYMIRDYVMPDQIHNYAHNHEWLIRDLSHVGRVRYGLELAKNLTEMPRHPKLNVPTKNGSAQYGRSRLVDLLQRFELWSDVVALADTPYLEATDVPREQVKRLRLLATAYDGLNDEVRAVDIQADLELMLAKEKMSQKAAADKAEAELKKKPPVKRPPGAKPDDAVAKARRDAENPFRAQIATIEAAVAELRGHAFVREEKFTEAVAQYKKAGITSGEMLSRVQLAAGNKVEAERLARDAVKKAKNQVVPLANLVYVLWELDRRDEATTLFTELRTLAAAADLSDVPVFERLEPIASELEWPADWRTPATTPTDVGVRPSLDALGPIRWASPTAPSFELARLDGHSFSLDEYKGRNVVLVFYLGIGCLHCTEQLKTFAPLAKGFRAAGFEIAAISSDGPDALRKAQADLKAEERYPFAIVPNDDLSVFKKYRAYDDFEHQPLHATVLVDAAGKVRWIDVGPDPFMDAKFLLAEAKRLLSLTSPPTATAAKAERVGE